MSLTNCKECKEQVSTSAKTCPHCGVNTPGVSNGKVFGVVAVVGFVLYAIFSPGETEPGQDETAAVTATQSRSPEELAACRSDLNCWGEEHAAAAETYCKPEIERLAQYEFEWTHGFFGTPFSRLRWVDQESGVIKYFGDAARASNAFDAFQNVIYSCDFDTESRVVISVEAEPGRI